MNVFWIFVSATDVPDKKKTVSTLNLSLLNRRWFLIFGTRPRKIPGNILNCHWLLISWIRQRRRLGNILFWIVAVSDFLNITKKSTRKHFKLSLTPDILYQIENISWRITAGGCARWRLWVAHSPDCGTFICLLVCLAYYSFDIWKIICLFVWEIICLFVWKVICLFFCKVIFLKIICLFLFAR